MTDTEPTTPEPTEPQGDPADLGEGGKRALTAERNRAAAAEKQTKALEAQVKQLAESQKAQAAAFAKALGLAPDETSDVAKLAEQVSALQQSFTDTQRANVVLSVANEHGITDKDDLALLSDAKDEEAVRRLAARIAKANESTTHTPKPDRTQGGTGGPVGTTPAQDFAKFLGAQLGR